MQVDIVTPEKVLFTNNDVPMVTVPGIEGQMGILDNHAPIITFLRPGVITEIPEDSIIAPPYSLALGPAKPRLLPPKRAATLGGPVPAGCIQMLPHHQPCC